MRMRAPHNFRHVLAAAAAGAVILLVGLAALRAQAEARELRARENTRLALDAAAHDIANELAALAAELDELAADPQLQRALLEQETEPPSATPHSLWRSDGIAVEVLTDVRFDIPAPQIARFLGEGDRSPLRIVTTNDGLDVILLKRRTALDASAGAAWIGAGLSVTELVAATALADVMRMGLNVVLLGEEGTPVFWSTPTPLTDPVASAVQAAGSQWELRAAPAGAWTDAPANGQTALLVGLLATGCGLAVLALASRPQALRKQVAGMRAELDAKDAELSRLLRSRSQIESQLVTSLTVDLYTGLPNRASFIEHVQAQLAKTRIAADGGVLLATVLLHKLGELGHSMGATIAEDVIGQAADRLHRALGMEAYLARTGESELSFCFALRTIADPTQLSARLLEGLEGRFTVHNRAVYVPAVVGIAASSDGYQHGPELLAQAALAANTAIVEGQRWSLFRPEAKQERISMLQLEADLQAAIDGNELRLFFQPIVSVAEGHIVGFESLLRWHHPTESWIGPDRFIPLAESMGQMARISDWVMRQGVAHGKQIAQLRAEPLYVTFNLTPRDLNRDLCARLFELLDAAALPAQCVRIEITETAVVRDFRFAARLIAELNERGVRVLLDDFGTGYSSLSYLRDLPFHAVKIDKSFIHRMSTEARDFGLVKSIVGLVHYLGMECVAEGIETQEQLDLIAMMDCNYWQGFLFSRPLPASEIEPLLRDSRRRPGMALAASR
jgi:EAL domain-containing protein (putative c-di-GMP-specific phosphodiesterase class I)/GGDEF domain-containing protein